MAEKEDGNVNAVSMEQYNAVVAAQNTAKTQMEKMQKELDGYKAKEEAVRGSAEQTEWKKLGEDLKKQMEELKIQVQQKDEKVSKGLVSNSYSPEAPKKPLQREELKKQIEEAIPTSHIKDTSVLSPIQRYGYYKGPTQGVSSQLFGRALSLHAGAISTGQAERSNWDRKMSEDIVVHRGQRNIG